MEYHGYGLKRGLEEELVVSSYGSILWIAEDPKEVIANLKVLENRIKVLSDSLEAESESVDIYKNEYDKLLKNYQELIYKHNYTVSSLKLLKAIIEVGAVSIWLSWLHRPVIRYIFEAEPRHQRMPLLPGLAGIILIFW